MKPKLNYIATAIAIALIAFLIGRLTSPSTPADPHAGHNANVHQGTTTAESANYTCSMHPQIQRPAPGDCPICGMDLIPTGSSSSLTDSPATLSLTDSARALAQIQTSLIERRFPEAEISLLGHLEHDETKVKSITSRFPARIDELFVNFTGVPVQKGDQLARVYSPELVTAQSELLAAHRYDPANTAYKPAYQKLLLWGLLPEQIDAIIEKGEPQSHLPITAPISGIVVSKKVNEGDYLTTGQALFTIVDLDQLWLQLEAYESDLAWLRYGQEVSFTVEAYPSQTFQGRIVFIDPEIDRTTRTLSLRANIPNTDRKLKPGMLARSTVRSRIAKAGKVFAPEYAGKWISPMHPEIVKDAPGLCDVCGMDLVPAEKLGYVQDSSEQAPLLVPSSAVLRTGKRSLVYIQIPDTEEPTYQAREIEIGPKAGDYLIVEAGLHPGDRVVTHGAFKIDSALQIKGHSSMMNPQGGGPTHGHNHGASPPALDHSQHETSSATIEIDAETAAKVMDSYFKLQTALAGDDIESSKAALKEMMQETGHSGPAPDLIHGLLAASSLEPIREGFETLSNALAKSVESNPSLFQGDILQMHCPMAFGGKGASWLQLSEPLQNPYYGAMMLRCGDVQKNLTEEALKKHAH